MRKLLILATFTIVSAGVGCESLQAISDPGSTPEQIAAAEAEVAGTAQDIASAVPAPWNILIPIGGAAAVLAATAMRRLKRGA